MPIIFDGKVIEVSDAAAPTSDFYFIDEARALRARFAIVKAWKGISATDATAYTWPLGKAPCTGMTIEIGKTYLVLAEWDKTKRNVLFDFCRDLRANDSISSGSIHQKLEQALKKLGSMRKEK